MPLAGPREQPGEGNFWPFDGDLGVWQRSFISRNIGKTLELTDPKSERSDKSRPRSSLERLWLRTTTNATITAKEEEEEEKEEEEEEEAEEEEEEKEE